MSRFTRLAAVLAAALFSAGCYTTKIVHGDVQGDTTEVHRRLQHTFIYGIVSPNRIDVDRVCKGGEVKAVKSQVAGLGLLANWITLGIYTPLTVKVTCAYNEKAWMDALPEDEALPTTVDAALLE
ncbi:MAG: hypothetical protein H6739_15355 [Alphaproteobacteria bacterium]|nr:hypothetical protein [Alphaproteobacteria bacterium]